LTRSLVAGFEVIPEAVTVIGGERSGRDLSIDCNGVALRFAADTDPSYVAAMVVALRAC
jgi:hypothetical protein